MALAAPATLAQTTVTLRSTARPAGASIELAEIAEIHGELAPRLARTIVQPPDGAHGWVAIDTEAVRAAVRRALGDEASLVALRGGPTSVLIGAPPAPRSAEAPSPAAPTPTIIDAALLAAEPTVRGRVALALARSLGVVPADLRVEFDARDAGLLAIPIHGRVADAQPVGIGARTPVSVKVFEGDRLVSSGTVRARVEVRRLVAIATRDLARGEVFGAADIAPAPRWLAPDADLAEPAAVIGQQARASVRAGEAISARAIERALAIRRGERVTVSVVSPTFVVEVIARARADAAEGDLLEFESIEDRTRAFTARAAGPGRAVASTEELR